MACPVIIFDYDFSAYAQKIKMILAAQGTPFQRNTVENLLPRKTLQALGIDHRRIPVLAIGKDVYADSSLITRVLQEKYTKLKSSPFDAALEVFTSSCLPTALALLPPESITPELLKDRVTVFPIIARPDISSMRPSTLAEWRCIFSIVQNQFLAATPGVYIGGAEISLADFHVAWLIQWVLRTIGLEHEPGFGEADWPGIYAWLGALPQPEYPEIENDTALRTILDSVHSAKSIGIDEQDPTGLSAGDEVSVESFDAQPGAHLQNGKLWGLSRDEIVLELPTGVRLHFPRRGYILRKA